MTWVRFVSNNVPQMESRRPAENMATFNGAMPSASPKKNTPLSTPLVMRKQVQSGMKKTLSK